MTLKSPVGISVMDDYPLALKPEYTTPEPNTTISLYEGPLELNIGEKICATHGAITLTWFPRPAVRLECQLTAIPDLNTWTGWVLIPAIGAQAQIRLLSVRGDQAVSILKPAVMGKGVAVNSVKFHLFNFHRLIGERVQPSSGKPGFLPHRLALASHDWELALDAVDDRLSIDEKLGQVGGYAITHVGLIRRTNGRRISIHNAHVMLEALHFFLGFCRGFWCGPGLVIGLDKNGNNVWEEWNPRKITARTGVQSWFPTLEPANTSAAFTGFLNLWMNHQSRDPIRTAIHWYVSANLNQGAVEGALVMSFTALELLSFFYLTELAQKCSVTKLEENNTGEIVCELLRETRVPESIPSQLRSLTRASVAHGRRTGPEILNHLRNSIVHGKKGRRRTLKRFSLGARREARELSQLYLELCLLRLLDYHGIYARRIPFGGWEGEHVTEVPWAV